MAYILLVLALLAAAAAVVLWRLADAPAPASEDSPNEPEDQSDDIFADFEPVDESPEEPAESSERDDDPAPADEPEPEHDDAPEKPERRRPSIPTALPGAVRRERKAWAQERGYEYSKHDPYLVDEFTRGAASGGGAPKDIVAGNEFGHEMLLMDIAGVAVMAMRTGAATDVVLDARRDVDAEPSDDLFEVRPVEGFTVYATDAAVAERFIDARVETALDNMPDDVTAVWAESEWVLAQFAKTARADAWTAAIAPLALFADAARVLPPRSHAITGVIGEDKDPSRMIPPVEAPEPTGPRLVPDPGAEEHDPAPPVHRPEVPQEMPSRRKAQVRGAMEHSAIGADEVDAIADGNERPQPDGTTARLPRDLSRGPSIFGDSAAEED